MSLAKPAVKPAKSSTKVKSPEPQLEAMEAWKRRKNYDPMAAAGKQTLRFIFRLFSIFLNQMVLSRSKEEWRPE